VPELGGSHAILEQVAADLAEIACGPGDRSRTVVGAGKAQKGFLREVFGFMRGCTVAREEADQRRTLAAV
jgi:hypothetical protein